MCFAVGVLVGGTITGGIYTLLATSPDYYFHQSPAAGFETSVFIALVASVVSIPLVTCGFMSTRRVADPSGLWSARRAFLAGLGHVPLLYLTSWRAVPELVYWAVLPAYPFLAGLSGLLRKPRRLNDAAAP